MNGSDFNEFDRFLAAAGMESLFDYFGLKEDADAETVANAISERRTWAQGQQSNPKFRAEALWIIKHQKLVQRTLLETRAAYLDHLNEERTRKNVQVLRLFIMDKMVELG